MESREDSGHKLFYENLTTAILSGTPDSIVLRQETHETLQGSKRIMRLLQRFIQTLIFFCVTKETHFLSSDLPIRFLLIARLTEAEMPRSLACVSNGLLGVFLVLFDAREESRGPKSTFSSVL